MTALFDTNPSPTPEPGRPPLRLVTTDLTGEAGATLSFDRCVDWLLSLHEETNDPQLGALVGEVLDELRSLGPVEGEFEEIVLGALASVAVAFEIAGAAA